MEIISKAALKAIFVTGAQPTESQFADLIDSILNLSEEDDLINISNSLKIPNDIIDIDLIVSGIENTLSTTTANRMFRLNDPIAVTKILKKFNIVMSTASDVYLYEMNNSNTIIQELGVFSAVIGLNNFNNINKTVAEGNFICCYTEGQIKYGTSNGYSVQYMTPHAPASVDDVLIESTLIADKMLSTQFSYEDLVIQDSVNDFTKNTTVFLGDSIGMAADPYNWITYLKQKILFGKTKNYCVSGATITHSASTVLDLTGTGGTLPDNVIWNQLNRLIDDYDNERITYPENIIILAMMNDFIQGKSPGVAATAYAAGTTVLNLAPGDFTDMATSFRYLIEKIYDKFPLTNIIFLTPYIKAGSTTSSDSFRSKLDVIEECSLYNSINHIRLDKITGIYPFLENTSHIYLYDGIHPNEDGAKKIAKIASRYITNFMI